MGHGETTAFPQYRYHGVKGAEAAKAIAALLSDPVVANARKEKRCARTEATRRCTRPASGRRSAAQGHALRWASPERSNVRANGPLAVA
jgi:hypothetical protein